MRNSEDIRLLKAIFPDFLMLIQLEEMLVAFGPDATWLSECVSFVRLHHLANGTPFAGFPAELSDVVLAELARANVDCIIVNPEQYSGGVAE